MLSVRGIGVAVIVRISTSARKALMASFCFTPNRCSSSIIKSPRSLKPKSLCSSLWVPTKISIFPERTRSIICCRSLPDLKRETTSTVKGQSANSLVVNLPGGQIGETGHWVEDVPNLMVNGRYLLFLAPDMDGKLTVIGGEQGAVRITKQGAKIGETLESATTSVEVCRVR